MPSADSSSASVASGAKAAPQGQRLLLDMRAFLEEQKGERYRAFVIHGRPLSGKTAFAQTLAAQTPGALYFDVLQRVAGDPDLAAHLDTFDAGALRDLVVAEAASRSASVLIADELDFLVHAWGDDLGEFQHMVSTLSVAQTPAIIGFILQTLPALEQWQLTNSAHHARVLVLDELAALPVVPTTPEHGGPSEG